MILSIDQNAHSLWDTLPKLQALRRAGRSVRHYLEDIDVAFTARGAKVDAAGLRIEPECVHADGGQEWGAALFYNDFLGRVPVDLRRWEPMLGQTLAATAKQLGRTPEELYQRYAVSDNWMLVGSSYLGDRAHHRLIGDLGVVEVAPFVRWIVQRAEDDCAARFPAPGARRRSREWFAREKRRVDRLLERFSSQTLPDLYRAWLGEHLDGSVPMAMLSERFALGDDPAGTAMLEWFLRDYETSAELYNRAIRETDVGLHELDVEAGELPFFAFYRRARRRIRCEMRVRNGRLLLAEEEFDISGGALPLEALRRAGVEGLAGKAVMLTIQVRLLPTGGPLAIPHGGSLYLPAAHRLAELLTEKRLLPGELAPIVRVRFRFLDRLRSQEARLHLPEHLAEAFGRRDIPAHLLGENYADLIVEARRRLESFCNRAGREKWQEENLSHETAELAEMDRRKRQWAAENPKAPRVRELWKRIRAVQAQILARTLDRIARDWQCSQLEFYDSRGALLPWCVALGGEAFYHDVLAQAELTEETHRRL